MTLEVCNLGIGFRRAEGLFGARPTGVVEGVEMRVEPGRLVGLVGESGAGKSLVASALMGGLPADAELSGAILLDGRPLDARTPGGARRGRLALAPQGIEALDPLAAIGAQLIRFGRLAGLGRSAAARRAAALLGELGLRGAAALRPHQLSGGMARRALLAAALMSGADHLIFDEPTAGLDPDRAREAFAAIRRLADAGRACLVISHDLLRLARVADSVVLLREGRLLETAPAASFDGAGAALATREARALWLAQPANRRRAARADA